MRTALILSGQLRCFDNCCGSLSQFVIDPNECDVYLHFYNCEKSSEAKTSYMPSDFICEKPNSTKKPLIEEVCRSKKAPETNVDNMFFMFDNIKKSFELIKDEKYDCVIRARYDNKFLSPLYVSEFDLKQIHVPSGGNWRGGLFDMFAFSSYENMKYYCSLIDHINDYVKDGVMSHPETLLKHHLSNHTVSRFEYPVLLRRKWDNSHSESDRIMNPPSDGIHF